MVGAPNAMPKVFHIQHFIIERGPVILWQDECNFPEQFAIMSTSQKTRESQMQNSDNYKHDARGIIWTPRSITGMEMVTRHIPSTKITCEMG